MASQAARQNAGDVPILATADMRSIKSKSLLQKALARIVRDRLTMSALFVLLSLVVLSALAPVISENILGVDYIKPNLRYNYLKPGETAMVGDTEVTHYLGTDRLGRDHIARLLYGGRITLQVAFFAAMLSLAIGLSLGVTTGYFGGIVDDIVIWFITTLNSIPSLFLLLIISAVLSPGPTTLILILGFLSWTTTTRLVRGETLSLREREFVIAARAVGAPSWRIMAFHIAPNVISIVIVDLAITIGGLILVESSLSFLSFGVQPPTPTWGNMLSDGLDLLRSAPHLVFAPGLLISITVLCLYVIGDGMRDAFDPRLND